jgi:hypothetical protein
VISRRMLAACATVMVLGGSANSVLAQDSPVAVDLSAGQPGSLPEGFAVARTGKGAPAAWAVVEDPTAHGGRALAQTSTDRTDHRFPLAIDQNVSAANLEVTVRFKAVSGQVDRAGGVAVRLADPNNCYVARANALEDNVNLYRVVKGVRTQIHGARTRVSSGEWHTLGLRAEGERFAVSFEGRPLFTAADQTFTGSGKVALWTKADSVTRFDDLAIRALP